jgi:hypothetical protein
MRAQRAAGRGEEPFAGAASQGHLGREREAGESCDPVARRQHQRHKRRHDRAGERVPEARGEAEPRAVGAALGERLAAACENHTPSGKRAGLGCREEALRGLLDRRDPGWMHNPRAGTDGLPQERIEHRAGRVADRKELARLLGLECHARRVEEGDGVGCRKPSQHLADRRGRAAGVVGLGDPLMGYVTAAATGHEHFRAELAGRVEGGDREGPARGGGGAASPGGREQAGGAGAEHEDVGGLGHGRGAREGTRSRSRRCIRRLSPLR